MKTRILSDLHISLSRYDYWKYEYCGEELLILAGDITTHYKHHLLLEQIPSDVQIILVSGNHESYGSCFDEVNQYLADLNTDFPNFQFLNNEWTIKDGIPIYGGTMFTDFNLHYTPYLSGQIARRAINDFYQIKVAVDDAREYRNWTPEDHIAEHKKFVIGLEDFTEEFENQKRVVISHFSPTEMGCLPQYIGDETNPYFISNMNKWLDDPNVIWIHGHIHNSVDLYCGETRVICNPRGYDHELNPDFNSNLIIDL